VKADPRPFKIRFQRAVADGVLAAINGFFDFYTGGRRRAAFFDVAVTAPGLTPLTARWRDIQAEVDALLATGAPLPRYHEIDPHIARISQNNDPSKSWRVFLLYAMGEIPDAARHQAPRTLALLEGVPGLYQAFFSVLAPGTSVPAHEGPYRGYLRYHLGLRVPKDNPPFIRVLDRNYVWKEGEDVLFDDSWDHEVVNRASERRVILIVDVLRPLPAFPAAVNRWFVRRVIHPLYARQLIRNLR
jgi:aspartyl/asparaginyl beta-hydroxylase (cupin superfamily)